MVWRNLVRERSLEGLGASNRLGLEGLLLYSCISTNFLVDHLPLGGWRRGFSPSCSISSSITRASVILCLHLSILYSLLLITIEL